MFRYRIYGEVLASELPFPELRAAHDGVPRWHFSVDQDRTLPVRPDGELIGEERIYGDVWARLLRDPSGGYWIHVKDTGTFHLSEDARTIRWRPNEEPWWDFGRAHLMGRVLPTAMHLDGTATLHGSAVATAEGVLAFLAPKHHGKSTLAYALVRSGAHLVTDDALPVLPNSGPCGRPMVRPGVHSMRFESEARADLGLSPVLKENREGKVVITDLPAGHLTRECQPLAAIYLLEPGPPGSPLERRRLDHVRATLALSGQMKLGSMLGSRAAGELLRRAAMMAGQVGVSSLRVPRDLEALDGVASRLLSWHGGPPIRHDTASASGADQPGSRVES